MSAHPFGRTWTAAEDATLRATYLAGGIAAARAKLRARTASAIFRRAQRLGLTRRRRWSPADVRKLRDLWGSASVADIARVLGRTPATVYHQAGHVLGLPRGVAQGTEYLWHAAQRTGYSTDQLRRILRARGVQLQPTMSRPRRSGGGRTFHCVDPIEVDDAVAAWLDRETVHAAAERRGLGDDQFRAMLREAGLQPPKMRGPARSVRRRKPLHWRVPTAAIDRAIAARAHTETITTAAARIGVCRQTMLVWLRAAGMAPPNGGRVWRVAPADVDRVASERRARKTARCARRAA